MNISNNKHLPEIDGLRAVAVLAVVFYHANVPGFNSGYLGVDIFFVISGYLITGLLHDECLRQNRIDFLAFYARRFRRLLPALTIVLATTLLAALLLLFPAELPRLGKAATAVVLMFSNLHFMKYSGGYFDPSVDVMPLLHTWSLSVEEQFYLFWPILIVIGFASAKKLAVRPERFLLGLLAITISGSFAYWLLNFSDNHNTAFYTMPARVWELSLGGIINFFPARSRYSRKHDLIPRAISSTALIIIIGAICAPLDHDKYAVYLYPLVVLFTTALIYSIHLHSTSSAAQLVLKSKPAIYIGLVSYGFYLWHWPLLSLTRGYFLGERLIIRDVSLILLALLIAGISYRFVETPIRRKRPWPFSTNKNTLRAALAITLAVIGLSIGVQEWGKERNAQMNRELFGTKSDAKHLNKCEEPKDGSSLTERDRCLRGPSGAPTRVVVWGDSHAGHLEMTLLPLAEAAGKQFLLRSFGACPPLLDAAPIKGGTISSECGAHNDLVFDEIKQLSAQGLRTVILASRWNAYLALPETNPAAITSYSLIDQWKSAVVSGRPYQVGSPPVDNAGALDTLERRLRSTLQRLATFDLQVLIVPPIPEPYFNAPHCLYRKSAEECTFSRSRVDERRRETLARLKTASEGLANVRVIDPIDYFCDSQTCRVKTNSFSMYVDTDHITHEMANHLASEMGAKLQWIWANK